MEFIASPGFFIALSICLGAHIAGDGDVFQGFRGGLVDLDEQPFFFYRFPYLSLFRSSTSLRFLFLLFFLEGFLVPFYGSCIPCDVADKLILEMFFYQSFMDFSPKSVFANSAKAREKVDSEGISRFFTNPQIMRRFDIVWRSSMSCYVIKVAC